MIFVLVGIGRSGTSLLQSILYHQDGIVVYPEIQLFRRFLIANDTSKVRIYREEFEKILQKKNPRYSNLREYNVLEKLHKEQLNFDEIINLFRNEAKPILFKDARDLDYLNQISSKIPDLEIICTIRDLRDVILSRMKAGFSKKWGYLLNTIIMRYQYTSLIKFRKGKHVNLIKYEDFTEGKFPMLEEAGIMNRGLGNIDLHKISEKLFSREELSKHKRKNKKTVDGSNSGKWKQDLPKRTVFLMELMFNDYFEQFEYERRFKGKIISMANKIVRVIFLVTYPVYHVISVFRDKNFYKI